MKRIFLPSCVVAVVSCFASQSAQAQSWISQGWGIGAQMGASYAVGDISSTITNTRGQLGLLVSKQLVPYLDLQGHVSYGELYAYKEYFDNEAPADLSFKSHYYTYNAQLKFDLTGALGAGENAPHSTYLRAGIGFIGFESTLFHFGEKIAQSGKTTELDFPLAIGYEYRFSPAFSMNLDIAGHIVNTKKLDVVENRRFKDMMFTPSIGVKYIFGRHAQPQQVPYPTTYTPTTVQQQQPTPQVEEEVTEVFEDTEPSAHSRQTTSETAVIPPVSAIDQQVNAQQNAQQNQATTQQANQNQQVMDVRATAAPATSREGLVYRVQIAAFQQFNSNMAMRLKEQYNLSAIPFEEIDGGFFKYTIGNFRTLDEAMAYRNVLVNQGVSEAFVVPYYVGKRITNQEARNLLQQQ
ncbi:MAG: outer membrane beta-barrel protein [Bacteroidales bacterium]|jgi:hypothetical protein|nr:outer membrane beta-barrel protein [Bacteroidales bacterium]